MGFIGAGLIMQISDDWHVAYRIASSSMLLALAVVMIVRESDMWSAAAASAPSDNRTVLWHPAYRHDLIVAVVLFGSMLLGIWAVLGWMPTYVAKISLPEHSQNNRSLMNIMFGAGNVFGGFFSGVLSNRIGRRKAAAIGYVGCIVATVLTLQTGLGPSPLLFAGTFAICVFIGLNQGILSGYIPELFPTVVRGAATGFGMNLGRILTAVGIFFLGVMVVQLGGYHNAISMFALAYVVGLITLITARETKGQELPL
jgi:MFS family permease